jgi:hypothetical protein
MSARVTGRVGRWLRWLACAGLGLAVVGAGEARGATKTLQNDGFDGSGAVACQTGAAQDEILAVRLTPDPTDYPFQIKTIIALVCPPGQQGFAYLRIWADDGQSLEPGAEIYTGEFSISGSSSDFNTFDLSAENLVISSGSIRVGIELFQDPGPSVATDNDGNRVANHNFVFIPVLGWFLLEDFGPSGDWIIRAEIEVDDLPPEIFADGFESGGTDDWTATEPSL